MSATDDWRAAFRRLAEAAHTMATRDAGVDTFRGRSVNFDTRIDDLIEGLDEFAPGKEALEVVEGFAARFGDARYVTLALLYQFFGRSATDDFDAAVLDQVLDGFERDLAEAAWTFVLLGNLTNFQSELARIDIADGVSIRHRDFDELQHKLHWGQFEVDALTRDWMEGRGASAHVLWVEDALEKQPDNLLLGNTGREWPKAMRAMQSMRLVHQGDVQVGSMFAAVRSDVRLKPGGLSRIGFTSPNAWGSTFAFLREDEAPVRVMYKRLEAFDALGQAAPRNVALALRRFEATHSRGLHQREDRILDSMTALEALLGSEDELTFKLSFRVASLLAESDDDRSAVFKSMKTFYRTRSKIVHGGALKQSDREFIEDDAPLRDLVRRMLRGFIHTAVEGDFMLTRQFVNAELDALLLHSGERERLRAALGLV